MNVTYYAKDMQEALEKIKSELGPDAIIVSSKLIRAKKGFMGMFSKKVYEVVANYEPKAQKTRVKQHKIVADAAPRPAVAVPPLQNTIEQAESMEKFVIPNLDAYTAVANAGKKADHSSRKGQEVSKKDEQGTFSHRNADAAQALNGVKISDLDEKAQDMIAADLDEDKIAELDSRIDDIHKMLTQFTEKFQYVKRDITYDYTPGVVKILQNLIDNDVDEEIAHEVCQKAQAVLDKRKDENPREVIYHFLEEIVGECEVLSPKKFERKVVMIVGPTGVGKTTTLVKLVSQVICDYGLTAAVINSDVYRVGAEEQLKSYVNILGIPLSTVFSTDDLERTMEQYADMDFVFIDTAGKLSTDADYIEDVKQIIDTAKVDEIYLAISSSTSLRTAYSVLDNYAFLGKHRLIITKIDEAAKKGAIINFCRHSGRPLSYMTIGQSVPDDIVKIDVPSLIREVMK